MSASHDYGHSHGHHEGHGHHHGHGHSHGHSVDRGRAFAVAVALNVGFAIVEVGFGLVSGSMALIADAGHNLSDVLALLLAWGASVLTALPPSERFTYGLKSSSILAAIANSALLWIALGGILVETVRRMAYPEPVAGGTMMAVAAVGIAVNTLSALLFMGGRKADINVRAAFAHMVADAAVSAGVVVAGFLIVQTGLAIIDPLSSLVITAVIGWSSWGLLKDSLRMGMLAAPDGIDVGKVRAFLTAQPGVSAVHDLHVWPMSTTETALTAHLVMPGGHDDAFLHALAHALEHEFHIGHPTIQIEGASGTECALESELVV